MTTPLQLSFRSLEPTPAIERRIREYAARLERFHPRIVSVRVLVEGRHHRHHKGNLYHVRVEVGVPGEDVVAARESAFEHAHEDVYVALRDAFRAARRQLEDRSREQRGAVKTHEAPPEGRVVKLFPDEGYGFIETPDRREIYFHRDSVLDDKFPRLEIGSHVRFVEEAGEQGPQASTVHVG